MAGHTTNVETLLRDRPVLVRKEARCRNCMRRPGSICDVLTCEELDCLDEIMVRKSFDAGQIIFSEGDALEYYFTVQKGVARATRLLSDGRRTILDFLYEGDFLGLNASGFYPYTAEAVSTVSLCCFPLAKFRGLVSQFPQMEERLLSIFQDRLIASQNQVANLARKSPDEKLATFLIDIAKKNRHAPEVGVFTLPMGREDIADHLGLTMETVSRTFSRFREAGLIEVKNRNNVRIMNALALSNQAQGERDG